jgi:hypothetical protein
VTINKTPALAPASTVLASRGQKTVPLDAAARAQVQQSTSTTQQSLATGRQNLEKSAAAPANQPKVATLNVPTASPAPGRNTPSAPGQKPSPAQTVGTPMKRDSQPIGGGEAPRGLPAAKQNATTPAPSPSYPNALATPLKGSPAPPPPPNVTVPVQAPAGKARPNIQPPPARAKTPPPRDDDRKK